MRSTEPIPVDEHAEIAREIAAAGTVLLRNEGRILPLGDDVASLAMVGPWAGVAATGGGGSSKVNPIRSVTPLDGIRERVARPGDGDTVRHTEDLAIGYRHYLAEGIEPLFHFGFGLSYSTFDLSHLDAPSSVSVGDTVEVLPLGRG